MFLWMRFNCKKHRKNCLQPFLWRIKTFTLIGTNFQLLGNGQLNRTTLEARMNAYGVESEGYTFLDEIDKVLANVNDTCSGALTYLKFVYGIKGTADEAENTAGSIDDKVAKNREYKTLVYSLW